MRNFRELVIWQKAMAIVRRVHKLTGSFPKEERYELTSQLNRALVSMPSNISEGCSRSSDADFARFLEIALGSAFEVETHLILSCDYEYITEEALSELLEELHYLQRQINKLITIVRRNR